MNALMLQQQEDLLFAWSLETTELPQVALARNNNGGQQLLIQS